MADSTDWTLNGLDNPLLIQHTLLNRFENETGTAIVDTNNPACVLMEMFATMSGEQMRMMDETVRPAIFPARAVSTADVMKHISDYDYVDIVSAPCQSYITLIVERNYIMTHSVDVYDDNGNLRNYKKLMIPRSTIITIGTHKFGLYYPIEFRSDRVSGRFSVLYDTTVSNPLKALETNVLDFEFREYNGHKLAYIKIPVYQFNVTGHDISLTYGAGFKKKIPYTDKFYALRAWADVLTNWGHDESESDEFKRTELDLRMSGQTYDPTTPTLIFTPDSQNSELLVELPYVYFTEGRIKGTLHIDIYTTEGYLEYTVPYNTTETCDIDMFSRITDDEIETYDIMTYAQPFQTMPALNAFPISSTISGGSNGLSFDELRERVVKGVNTNVLQTPDDIDAYFSAYGYKATLYRDGITDRIFIVSTTVKDTDGTVVGMDVIPTKFDFDNVSDCSTIIQSTTDTTSYTVLPSTRYKFDKDKGTCTPLTDIERQKLENLSPTETVEEFNSNVYTLSPFHLQINASKKYPTSITYDMLQVKRMARTFIASRDDQYGLALNTVNLDVYHREGEIADRYMLSFRVSRVGFSTEIPVLETSESGQAERKIRVLVGLKDSSGEMQWAEAKWNGSEDDGNEVFSLILTPNYIFHQTNNEHTVEMAFWDNKTYSDFLLRSECRVILLLKNNQILTDTTSEDGGVVTFSGSQELEGGTSFASGSLVLPTSKSVSLSSVVGMAEFYAMTEHKCVFQFGSPIDELDQRVNLTYREAEYQTHKTTKFRVSEEDKYRFDEYGKLKLTYDYVVTKDTTFQKGKFYFLKNGDEYEQADVVIGNTISSTYYERSVSIEKISSKGALKCMEATTQETIYPNKYTASNYVGCTGINDTGKTYELTQEVLDKAIKNKESVSITDAPIAPRFNVASASKDKQGCLGDFELANAKSAKAISSMDNIWVKTDLQSDEDDQRSNMIVKSINALPFVLNNLAKEIEIDPSATDPFKYLADSNLSYKQGTFLLVSKDGSTQDTVILGTIGDAPTSGVYTRLYYKFRDLSSDESGAGINDGRTWVCYCQGKSKEDILKKLTEDAATINPKLYGIMYAMVSVLGDATSLETEDTVSQIHYASFLTTTELSSAEFVYSETEDTTAIASKTYYLVDDDSYRAATDEDFNSDGSFVSGVAYFERIAVSGTYTIPDFTKMEKSAWEAHTVIVPSTDLTIVEGRQYCYKDKDLYQKGITKWIDIEDPIGGAPIEQYITADQCGGGIVYYKKYQAECTDTDFAWEQNANRWPWECDWFDINTVYQSDDKTVDYKYIGTDASFDMDLVWGRMHRYLEYSSGQVILDENGQPLSDYEKDRSMVYQVDMTQMDAKLAEVTVKREDTRVGSNFGDDGNMSNSYPNTVVTVLRNHFDTVSTAKNTMFTNTRLFFEPIKSLGYARFNVGDGLIKSLPLDISISFRLHITKSAYDDDILLEQMRKSIIAIIDETISAGTVNCAEIASKITENMDETVLWVDVLGINGDPDLQTMRCVDEDATPHLKCELKLLSDGVTIDSDRGLSIEAVINE